MENRWSDRAAAEAVDQYGSAYGERLALRTYTSRLLGAEPALVLHGGGNTSLKDTHVNVLGERIEVLRVKASGVDLRTIAPEGHVAVDLDHLRKLRALESLPDDLMVNELRAHLVDASSPTPSIETLVHAFVPGRFVDHTHADAILTLTNQPNGEALLRKALGDEVSIVPYVRPGFRLAKAVSDACDRHPDARAMVWMHHGILTWGDEARESYERMIRLVTRAERFLNENTRRSTHVAPATEVETARRRLSAAAPIVRGLLAARTGEDNGPYRRVVVCPLISREVLDAVDAPDGRALLCSPPLTTDHLIRTRPLPAWIEAPDYASEARLREQIARAVREYEEAYRAYVDRHRARMPANVTAFDPQPRVLFLPGLGALCAGATATAALIAKDITSQTLTAKKHIADIGGRYLALDEEHLFDMEYLGQQHAKLKPVSPLQGHVALITGAAGAIGSAIASGLLSAGVHVALTDLPGAALDGLAGELRKRFPNRVTAIGLDVTDPQSVARGFDAISETWGGVDLVVINAGLAHVSALEEMDLERFRRLQRVNTDGTLLLLRQAARHFRRQGTGGDIVLVSTKNVFAPGARFGAYSSTKAAAHQLARIASLELAEQDVRVNMVAPDAVFSHGERRSGLWAEVGPDRMRARGLDEHGLEEYYRNRNLLKARVTGEHVANAVLFFAMRQTPTTGATLPVDGGLPDAAPR